MGPIRLTWEERGEARYAIGKCIDVSEGGLRIEIADPIPARTEIVLNADRINISGLARVRHLRRHGAKHIIGVELSGTLRENALASIRTPARVV